MRPRRTRDGSRPGEAVPTRELIGFVRAHLPLFMLPSRFVHREEFPTTGNGKIDRLALAATDA